MPIDLRRSAWLFLGVLCALPACGSELTETSGPSTFTDDAAEALAKACGAPETGPSGDLATACMRLVKKRTGYLRTCSLWGEPEIDEEAVLAACVGLATAPGAAVSAKEIDGCAEEVCQGCPVGEAPSCLGYGANLLFPGHDQKGTRKPGEACVAHLQCDTGYCSASGLDCGQCEVPRALGETCDGAFDFCVDGRYWCTDGVCQLPGKKLGEKCIDYGGGDCQSSLFCKPLTASTIDGVCVTRGQADAACKGDDECASGLYCGGTKCAPYLQDGAICQGSDRCVHTCVAGVCGVPQLGLHEGDDCTYSVACRDGLLCEEGVCVARKHLAEGDLCYQPGGALCPPDLMCDWTDPGFTYMGELKCMALPEAGEPCMHQMSCAKGATCVGFAPAEDKRGVCTKQAGMGGPCPCEDDLFCDGGKCVPFGAGMCD